MGTAKVSAAEKLKADRKPGHHVHRQFPIRSPLVDPMDECAQIAGVHPDDPEAAEQRHHGPQEHFTADGILMGADGG